MSGSVAFVFPGQGSQAVGMGAEVYRTSSAARRVFAIADEALGFSLSQLCFEGPENALKETVNTQPAIVTTSLALLAALQEAATGQPFAGTGEPPLATPLGAAYLAGHSVGEFTALVAAGALSIAETVRLVRERGRLMHEEGQRCPSGMAAVLGLPAETLERICAGATARARAEYGAAATEPAAHVGLGRVVVANDNAPGQIVLSGEARALALAQELATAEGARRVIPLAVSGGFHSPVMAPAAERFAAIVRAAPIRDAAVPIISNIQARPLRDAADLRDELAHQIAAPVQWTRSIEYLVGEGVTTCAEIGAGQVLAGLIRRIAKQVRTVAVDAPEALGTAVETLRA